MDDNVELRDAPLLSCSTQLTLTAVSGVPDVSPGDDLGGLLCSAIESQGLRLQDDDVLVVSSKVVAKAEGRLVDLARVEPSARARELAVETGKDPRWVEVILWDTEAVSRVAPNVLIVRHVLGHVSANAGIDQSNVRPPGAQPGTGPAQPVTGPWLLRLPADPDASARALRVRMTAAFGVNVSVLISDSFGRPFRLGTVGVAIGVAGFPAVWDQRGRRDLYGRTLEATLTAPADQLAGACDLLLGQAAERRAAAVVRGIRTWAPDACASDVCRPAAGDLYL